MSDVNTKLTALADEVRELSGSTEPLSIDAMTTNISNANDEVSTQADLIAQIKDATNNLPDAGSGGTENILFGSYGFKQIMTSPEININTKLYFNRGEVTAYFFHDMMQEETLVDVANITLTNDRIQLTSFDEECEPRYYIFGKSFDFYWESATGRYADGWERIINFNTAISVSDDEYQAFVSLLSNPSNPYEIGYALGFSEGYSTAEEDLGSTEGGMLTDYGYMPLLVYNESGELIFLNGGFEPVIPFYGLPILFSASCSADTFSSLYFYAVNWTDFEHREYEVLEPLTPIYLEANYSEQGGEIMTAGYIEFYDTPPQAGLLITSSLLEMEE